MYSKNEALQEYWKHFDAQCICMGFDTDFSSQGHQILFYPKYDQRGKTYQPFFIPQDFTYPCPICNWNWHWMRVFFIFMTNVGNPSEAFWTRLDRTRKNKMKTTNSQKPSNRSSKFWCYQFERRIFFIFMTNVEYPLEACGYIVLYTSLPSEKCISMCIHRKQKFALTTTTKFLFA